MTEREHKMLLIFACLCLLLLIFRVRGYIGGSPAASEPSSSEPAVTAVVLNNDA